MNNQKKQQKQHRPNLFRVSPLFSTLFLLIGIFNLIGCSSPPLNPTVSVPFTTQPTLKTKPVIGLALGGGAARGFAHIGVLKILEANGIKPDMIVGTSAGSVIGSMYASGISANDLQRIAINFDEATFTDWTNPFSGKVGGLIKGDALQNMVNNLVKNRPIEQMNIRLGIIATDLNTGKPILFQKGDTGQAVRASSSVPGVFMPTTISGRDYVDGGLTAPVPIKFTRDLGADIVIAVNISANPVDQKVTGLLGTLKQTTVIMSQSITQWELPLADVIVIPELSEIPSTDFQARNHSILAGEVAMQQQMSLLKTKIANFNK